MADNLQNLNIFDGAPPLFRDALGLFSGLGELCIPIAPEPAGLVSLYTIPSFSESGQVFLPAFTAEGLVTPPFIRQPVSASAVMFFHAPSHDLFAFNPAHVQARQATTVLKASRRDMSLLAGFIKAGAKAADGDPLRLAAGEYAMGNLHAAHYLYTAAAARNPGSRARFALGFVLVELGLLQEAYDELKAENDPEARLCLAMIHRKTGNPAQARELLAVIGQGTQLDEKKAIETAWLDLESAPEEAEKNFQRLTSSSFDKTEALSGLGAAMSKNAFRTKDRGRLAAAASTLRSALSTPSPASGRIFFQLGNLYFRSGELPQAESCYRRSAALAPAVQALANLALTLIKTGKLAEAARITEQIALTDIASAKRLAAEFPRDKVAVLFQPPDQTAAAPAPAQAVSPARAPEPERPGAIPPALPAAKPAQAAPAQAPLTEPRTVPSPAPAAGSGLESSSAGFKFINPSATPPGNTPRQMAGLSPASPRDSSVSGRAPKAPAPARELKIETMRDIMTSPSAPTEEESRKDDFISRAFRLASELEDEFGKKIYFNLDGLSEVERKLRVTFIKARNNPQGNIEAVRDGSAFLCYFLQERHKGRLIKLPDFDPWGWPMIFELPNMKFTTYPIQRVWRLLWEETVPEPGWLAKYSDWISGRLHNPAAPAGGAAAAKGKIMSHPERVIDVQTEHKRMLVLASSLNETSGIELSRTGILKLENAIKAGFKPDIPPTADGWKLLRCYGHLLAEILVKDFKAVWYNVDGDDGGWSMRLPWNTLVFPLGKVYKTASTRGDLGEYYETILGQKLRSQPGPTGM